MKILIAFFVLALLGCQAAPKPAPEQKPAKWEYVTLFATDGVVGASFDGVGKLRWEAIWCRRSHVGTDKKVWGLECLFKRPVVEK